MPFIKPLHGPTMVLPQGIGEILAKLLPQTKSSQVVTMDVVMAYNLASGISLSNWLSCLEALLPDSECTPKAFIMAHWNNHFFGVMSYVKTYVGLVLKLLYQVA
jgi:hypothetical protein